MDVANLILPVTLAYCGKACTNCSESGGSALLRCTSCKLAHYCCKDCQKADWPKHKVECKLLRYLKEHAYKLLPGPEGQRCKKAERFLATFPLLLEAGEPEVKKGLPTLAQFQKMDKGRFSKFVIEGRVCSVCLRNEFTEASLEADWKCCPHCSFGWCCGSDHWDQYYSTHHTPEICNMYQADARMNLFHYKHAKKCNEIFLNVPEQGLATPVRDFPTSWDAYFRLRFPDRYPQLLGMLPPEFFPASTYLLSQPVTCLSAMYKLGISQFLQEEELVIHVVGADCEYEIPATCVWEEISHCLPNVKTLTIEFVGPNACKVIQPPVKELPTEPVQSVCPACTRQGRTRLVGMYAYTYHDYMQEYSGKKPPPNFIVAFNTGMHEEYTESWKTSVRTMLDMKVPSYFTSYNEEEAVQDLALLQSLDANILQ